jgi:ribonuclease HI
LRATTHTDGGVRDGFGCGAATLLTEDHQLLEKALVTKGAITSNQAEYMGVILALETVLEFNRNNPKRPVTILNLFSDSQLIIRQLKGRYKVKNEGLKPYYTFAYDLGLALDSSNCQVTLDNVRREDNQFPDALCNLHLDRALGRKTDVWERKIRRLRYEETD